MNKNHSSEWNLLKMSKIVASRYLTLKLFIVHTLDNFIESAKRCCNQLHDYQKEIQFYFSQSLFYITQFLILSFSFLEEHWGKMVKPLYSIASAPPLAHESNKDIYNYIDFIRA